MSGLVTRVGYSSESKRKKTVGITLPTTLVKRTREHRLNISRITEQALLSVLDYLETSNQSKEGISTPVRASQPPLWCGRRDSNPGRRLGRPEGGETAFSLMENVRLSTNISWAEARKDFIDYLRVQEYDERTVKDVVSYLDRYTTVIQQPQDVLALFGKVKAGKRHMVLALRLLFNFHEALGFNKAYLDVLRNMLPKIRCGIDLKIPSEAKIVESFKKLPKAPLKYQALYSVLLDSGLRLIEAVELINTFQNAEAVNGFYRCEIAMFRGEKQAYYGHFSERTLKLIKQVEEKLDPRNASHYFCKFGYVPAKYLRKYAFDKMIELEIPESIADFIQGRVPKRIGAKHYMALARQASKFYPRYMDYIEKANLKVLA